MHVTLRRETTLSPCSCHKRQKIVVSRPDDAALTAALTAARCVVIMLLDHLVSECE